MSAFAAGVEVQVSHRDCFEMANAERDWLGTRKVTLVWSWLLALYLILVAAFAAWVLIAVFPSPPDPPRGSSSAATKPPKASAPTPSAAATAGSGGSPGSGGAALAGSGELAGSGGTAIAGSGGNAIASSGGTAIAGSGAAVPPVAAAGTPAVTSPPPNVVETPDAVLEQERPTWPTNLKYGSFHLWSLHIVPCSNDQGILILALLAGVLGSFMHAGQSLTIYVGNRDLRRSWVLLYVLRPWIGGVLGLLFYFVLRAGLIPAAAASSTDAVSPYGVVAFGALAGWFSKRVTDKLAEMVDMLFRTQKDAYRDNTLRDGRPEIVSLLPDKLDLAKLSDDGIEIVATCERLLPGAWFWLDGKRYDADFRGDMKIAFKLTKDEANALGAKSSAMLLVYNPPDPAAAAETKPRPSAPFDLPIVSAPAGSAA